MTALREAPAVNNKPTVFVVDDDRHMRRSLVTLLEAMELSVRAFPSAHSFHQFYRPQMPGILLLDVQLPVQNGLQFYEKLLQEGKRLPVIFLTAQADVSTAVSAMKCGALDFLEKPFDRKTLVERIQQALALDAQWRQREAEFTALEQRIGRLDARDRETLDLVLAGESNKAMAARLFLTERAVEMRRAALMRKLQVQSLAELFELAVSHRILSEMRCARNHWQSY